MSNGNPKPVSDEMSEQIEDGACKDFTCSESDSEKKEDSDYCIIRNESETRDGWLVVSED